LLKDFKMNPLANSEYLNLNHETLLLLLLLLTLSRVIYAYFISYQPINVFKDKISSCWSPCTHKAN
jgi:hypothetical protein